VEARPSWPPASDCQEQMRSNLPGPRGLKSRGRGGRTVVRLRPFNRGGDQGSIGRVSGAPRPPPPRRHDEQMLARVVRLRAIAPAWCAVLEKWRPSRLPPAFPPAGPFFFSLRGDDRCARRRSEQIDGLADAAFRSDELNEAGPRVRTGDRRGPSSRGAVSFFQKISGVMLSAILDGGALAPDGVGGGRKQAVGCAWPRLPPLRGDGHGEAVVPPASTLHRAAHDEFQKAGTWAFQTGQRGTGDGLGEAAEHHGRGSIWASSLDG